jgi:hypothetical protein
MRQRGNCSFGGQKRDKLTPVAKHPRKSFLAPAVEDTGRS